TIAIWKPDSGSLLRSLAPDAGPIHNVAWKPDGALLASASNDKAVRIWNPATGRLVRVIRSPSLARAVAWSPDGGTLASGHSDGMIRFWNAKTGRVLRQFRGHLGLVFSIAWDPNGQLLASVGNDGAVRLWSAHTGEPSALETADHALSAIAWSPNGELLA